MANKKKADGSGTTAGLHQVKENSLEFQHGAGTETTPCTPEEYLVEFDQNFEMRILERPSPNEIVFEFINADTSFVNALRRILLSEVPTVAIEDVFIWENSGLIHDEVLAHRLGLVPLQIDARYFLEKTPPEEPTDRNTVVFKLQVECTHEEAREHNRRIAKSQNKKDNGDVDDDFVISSKPKKKGSDDNNDVNMQEAATKAAKRNKQAAATKASNIYHVSRPYTKHVYSSDLEWDPQGDQAERFQKGIFPVHDDILLAKLRPGQSIDAEAHGRRGIGKDHAKFSPVATASYRLTPHVELLKPVYDEVAEELVHLYEPGVFELVACDGDDPKHTKVKAKVCNPYACTMSRNYMKHPELKDAIRITREPNRFIFSIESVGMYDPAVLLAEAIRVLQNKCTHLSELIQERHQPQQQPPPPSQTT